MNPESHWVEQIPEFKIGYETRDFLRLLTRTSASATLYHYGAMEATEQGWVTSQEIGGRPVYTLTDLGRAVCRQLGIGGGI
jgi:hypothetical protein